MGGVNSGRRNGKPLVEDCLTLDLAWLIRQGAIREGQVSSGKVDWSAHGAPLSAIRFRLDLREEATAQLILCYNLVGTDGKSQPANQAIALTAAPQHLGGRRWWLRCPATGERVRVLYLQPDGQRFVSRKALGLAYRVERLSRFDRPFEKLFREQRKLGGLPGLGAGIERPKGMWRRTFARHVAALERHDLSCAAQIGALMGNS